MKNLRIFQLFFITLLYLNYSNAIDPFCRPLTSNIDPSQLPKLPMEFQTRIEMNLISQQKSQDLTILYDYYDKKAEILTRAQNKTVRTIYYFDKNEQITIQDGKCNAVKLNQSTNNLFFGLVSDGVNGINMQTPNYFFHFNNGFPHVKVEQTTWAGVAVNRFQSCQNWPELNANVLIDYYFTLPTQNFPITLDQDDFKEIPVAAVIEGYINMNDPQPIKIKHEYDFFEFRKYIERKSELFLLPSGLYCDGLTYKEPLPQIPETFSFTDEIISRSGNNGTDIRINYAYNLKAVRYDIVGNKNLGENFDDASYKVIHDFNSGVEYIINKENQNCAMFPLGTNSVGRNEFLSNPNNRDSIAELKPPNAFFNLDDSYFYAGQRFQRDRLCDVFITKYDIKEPDGTPDSILIEFYLQNQPTGIDQGTDKLEQVVPVSTFVRSLGNKFTLVNNIYDFDSTFRKDRYDISQCFQGRDKVLFGIRFSYPKGMNQSEFEDKYGRLLAQPFEKALIKAYGDLEASPLRIVSPKIDAGRRNGFVVYSGLTSSAPDINHFKKMDQTRIDPEKVKYKFKVDSPTKCASLCNSKTDMSSITQNNDFRCRSFDYCSESGTTNYYCSFYDSIITDPDIVSQNAPTCDHYSKISKSYDSASVDQLYRSVKEAIIKKNFIIELKNSDGTVQETFQSEEIFESVSDSGSSGQSQTSFTDRFDLFLPNQDLNDSTILEISELALRKKSPSTIDECARLCISEPSFDCQSMSYSGENQECKWSSLMLLSSNQNLNGTVINQEGTDLFIRDPLYNYIEYPFKVTSLVDYSVADVVSPNECAFKCDKDPKIKCRSFNLCKKDETTYRCLLSETNIHNTDKDPNVVYSALCSHFSKRAITDFQIVPQTQLSVDPQTKIANTSIETCAEICSFEDSYFCRSFDFFVDTRTCYLYTENLKDKYITDLGVKANPNCNHYSRLYYEENGVLNKIDVLRKKSNKKYGGGTMFGVIVIVMIGGLLFGGIIAFAYMKITKQTNLLPVMKFVNPNYENQS